MVTIVSGLLSSLSYASSDLLSQRATRAVSTLRVILWVLIVGSALVLPPALAVDGLPSGGAQWRSFAVAAVAGVFYVAAYFCLLAGLRVGDLSLITALTALQGAFVVVFAVIGGERVTALIALGLALAVVGGALAGLQGRAETTAGARWALLSAFLFAVVIVLYDHAQSLTWLQVTAVSRVTSLLSVALVVTVVGAGVRLPRRLGGTVVAAGALEVLGLVLLNVSVAAGPLAVAGVMISQFATFGLVLGTVLLHERPRPHQLLGVACTIVAVSILAAVA